MKCDPGRWQRLVRGGPSTFEKRNSLISAIHHCLLRSATGSLQGAAELKGRWRCREKRRKRRRKEKEEKKDGCGEKGGREGEGEEKEE